MGSMERAIIQMAQPNCMTRTLAAHVDRELTKGCTGEIHPVPVQLEPHFHPLMSGAPPSNMSPAIPAEPVNPHALCRLRIWVSPNQKCDWQRSERFLKEMASLGRPVGFEVSGNVDDIRMTFLCCRDDSDLISTLFRAEFEHCEITREDSCALDTLTTGPYPAMHVCDFHPPPPYSHLMTTHDEIKSTTFRVLLQALTELPEECVGFYQVVYQPVSHDHNWHRNVETLVNLEYQLKQQRNVATVRQYFQDQPDGDRHQMAMEVDTKAHNDKPFFCAVARAGIAGDERVATARLRPVAACLNLLQHGGRPLESIGTHVYREQISDSDLRKMIALGATYRPGFLVNSKELTSLVHVFPVFRNNARPLPLALLETLPVRSQKYSEGTRIGVCRYADREIDVCIPAAVRNLSTHVISAPGMGKTTVLHWIALQDMNEGKGLIYLDAQGVGVQKLRTIIPPRLYEKTIYFAPGHPEWIPLWNPLAVTCDRYRLADNIVGIFGRVFPDWGARVAHVLRNGVIGLSYVKGTCLMDLFNLTRQKSGESETLRKLILGSNADVTVKAFWEHDFLDDYRRSDLQAPRHKLSSLIQTGNLANTLAQPENRIDIREIMDAGNILLVDLSYLGEDAKDLLGSILLSLVFTAASQRSNSSSDLWKPFSIIVDEGHRFVAGNAISDIIAETRKFRISLCLAHQFLAQFDALKTDALSAVGCTICGRTAPRDGTVLAKNLQGLVEPDELAALDEYEMIVRMGKDVMRMHTLPPPVPPPGADEERLLALTHQTYCKRIDEVLTCSEIRTRQRAGDPPALPGNLANWRFEDEDLRFDEF